MMPRRIEIAITHDDHGGYEVYGSAYQNNEEIEDMVREQAAYKSDWEGVTILVVDLTRNETNLIFAPETPKKSWWRRLCGL